MNRGPVTIRPATADDGAAVARLVEATGVLDANSIYAYVLLFDLFGPTCVVAEQDGEVVGFVSGLLRPQRAATYFLWQVGVAEAARGQGLAKRMIGHLLTETPALASVDTLETTVTPDNGPSRRLFAAVARDHGAELTVHRGFTRDQLGGDHADEELLRITPLSRRSS